MSKSRLGIEAHRYPHLLESRLVLTASFVGRKERMCRRISSGKFPKLLLCLLIPLQDLGMQHVHNHKTIIYTWFGQYCLRPQSTLDILLYHFLNELQIVDQQISLTQCISHTLEKYTLCVLLTLSEKYYNCIFLALLKELSHFPHLPCSSLSLRSPHTFHIFSLIRSSQFIGIGEAPIHDEK
jgi:hypothetical protein